MNAMVRDGLTLAVGAALAGAGALLIDPGLLFLFSEVLVLLFLAQMWNLLAGYGGQVSLGHQAFVGMGAYALFFIANNTALSPWLVLLIVPVLVGLIAIPLGAIVFNLKHAYFAIGMWVVAEIAQALTFRAEWLGGSFGMVLRPNGEIFAGNPEQLIFFIGAFGCVALMVALRRFLGSPLGLALLCVRDNEPAAASAGVNVYVLYLFVFALSAGGCAAAGALFYMTALYVAPADAFQVNWAVAMMFIAVVGGLGTLAGPVLGVAIFIGLRETMAAFGFSGGTYWIVMGVIAIATLLLAPRGLWPALTNLATRRKSLFRRVSEPEKW
ncbi:branched-chain amino acid ABC transporter permease [Pelagibacterium halotolerans]|uniref:branched-chain amino acid ABC transporter permease n=1 Tax=Pelagibacterium halotolerans TaxID=531813 RepID=UPI00384F73C7